MPSFSTLKFDLPAGLTVGIVALPLALGFGITTGSGAASGLATAIVAGFIAALFGGSNFQVSGPTGAMTVVLVPIVAAYGVGVLFVIGVAAGALVILMGLLRLGRFIERVPWSVMEGFTLGIALVIALQQLPLVFEVDRGEGTESLLVTWNTLGNIISQPVHWNSLIVVAGTLLVQFGWGRWQNLGAFRLRIPPSAVAVLVVSLVVWLTGFEVAKIGALPAESIFVFNWTLPTLPFSALLYPIIAVALLAAIESLLAARVADSMAHRAMGGDAPKHNPNRELVGQGLASIGSAIVGGMPATGAIARTGVNVESGARTRLAAMIHALALAGFVFVLAPAVAEIPLAVLAAVLLTTSWRIASPSSVREALQTTTVEKVSYLATAIAVLSIDLIWGTVIGILVHLALKKLL